MYHKTFGTNISWVKSIVNENWTDEEVMFIQISGNKRFLAMMKDFGLAFNQSIEYKYSVVAADYYRNLVIVYFMKLFCELNNRDKPQRPDNKTGQKLIVKYLEEQSQPKSFFGKVDSFFSNVKTKISNEAQQLDQKYDISGKGKSALIFAKSAGDKIVEKGKEISVRV